MRALAAIFDRDDVLLEMDWRGIDRELLSRLPLRAEEVIARWRTWSARSSSSAGDADNATVTAFLDSLREEIADPAAREALARFHFSRFVRAFPDARPALAAARERGLRVGVLSNNTVLMSPRGLLSLVGLNDLVDVALTAQGVGASKPAPQAYQAAAAALGISPERCLFFDNNASWVEGARAVGVRSYHVDRSRAAHDLPSGVVRDLSAIVEILTVE